MAKISLLCYSDIHHDYYTNGITLEDTLALEDEVLAIARKRRVTAIINGGDRFASRNPLSSLRIQADLKIHEATIYFPEVAVLGNHCREAKNPHSGHSMSHLKSMENSINLRVIDEAGVYTHSEIPGVEFHVIPAGQIESYKYEDLGQEFKVLLFHDVVKGSTLSGGMPAHQGIDPDVFDRPEYNVVIGGDNHIAQVLPFKNTLGFYIGAPCQHNWGDAGQERGFALVTLESGRAPIYEFIKSSAPMFITVTQDVSRLKLFDDEIEDPQFKGNVVRIKLSGDTKALSKLDIPKLERRWLEYSGAKSLRVITEPTIVFKALVPELAGTKTSAEDWATYIDSGHADVANTDPERVKTLGLEVLNEAHNG